jgi:hypothetical protein
MKKQYNTKKRLWIIGLLNKLGLEVLDYQPQLSSKSHVQIKVKPLWYDPHGSQTLTVYVDPGYKINFKFSKHIDNRFMTETECMVAALIMGAVEEYCGPDVDVSWVPYHKSSSRGSSERPDSCYLRLSCPYLPWNPELTKIQWFSKEFLEKALAW